MNNATRVGPAGPAEWSLLLLLACIWSLSFVFIKIAVPTLPPFNLAAARLLLAACVLGLFLAWRRRRLPAGREDLAHYLFIGLFGNALPFTLIGWGEQTVDSGLAAILMGLMPLLTPLLAHYLIPDEPLSAGRLAGIVLGFAGVLTVSGAGSLGAVGSQLMAQAAVLCGAVCYAITTIYTRRRVHTAGPELATGATAAGALLLAPLAWLERPPTQLEPSPEAIAAAIMLGLFATGLATLIYFHLLRRIGASRFSQINYVIPVLGALWGTMLLGERPAWHVWAGLALILCGILLVNRPGAGNRR